MRKAPSLAALVFCLVASLAAPAPARVSTPTATALVARDGIIRGDLGAAHGGARATARWALRRYADRLGVSASDFRFDSLRRSIVGRHVRGSQYVDGVPVAGTSAAVHIVSGRIVWVEARGIAAQGAPATAPISRAAARTAALARLGVNGPEAVSIDRALVAHGANLVDTYTVTVFSLSPAVAASVEISAAAGAVLAVKDANRYADGTTTVFDPNPIVTAKDNTLREPGVDEGGVDTDLDSAELTAQLKVLPVKNFDELQIAAGRLVGPWASVQGPAPLVTITPNVFDYTRGDPRFETLMAYAHIDRYQRYLQNVLGFKDETGINAEAQDVYALPVVGFDNSFYQPGNDLLLFGAGGVDDGEDAEVILHEYGHAVQDAQVPGWGATAEGGAMGEGFGDFQAAAYYARRSDGFQDLCIMDWDATSYSSATPPCLRRLDSPKKYPGDWANEVHDDGEMWAAFLWRVREALYDPETADEKTFTQLAEEKSDNALKLVLTSHEFLTTQAKFRDAVLALITAAQALNHPEWSQAIVSSAKTVNFPTD